MEKIYTFTIRDLSNEAIELGKQEEKLLEFKEKVNKEIKILAKNHITAIASYLNHQLSEVSKITHNFHMSFSTYGVYFRLSAVEGKYVLEIKSNSYSGVIYRILPNNTIEGLERNGYNLELLMRNWDWFKSNLNKAIENKIEAINKTNKEVTSALKAKKYLYDHFEI